MEKREGQMQEDPELRRTLWFLLGGKRGGENRARIIWTLRTKPSNMNQLATVLNLQYRSIQHHVKILVGSALVAPSGEGYGAVYLLTPWFEGHFETFQLICQKLGFTQGSDESNGTNPGPEPTG